MDSPFRVESEFEHFGHTPAMGVSCRGLDGRVRVLMGRKSIWRRVALELAGRRGRLSGRRTPMPTRTRAACACILGITGITGAAAAQVPFCYSAYTGIWHNHTFNTTGPITATLVPGNVAVWITFDAGGSVFGGGDPPPVTIAGWDFQPGWEGSLANDPNYGTISAHITPAGAVTVQGSVVPSPFVSSYSATGT